MVVVSVSEMRGVMLLSFDEGTTLRVRKKHFALAPLGEGDFLEYSEYVDRVASTQWNDCMEAALKVLDRSAQTSAGLREKLIRAGYVPPVAERVTLRLEEIRLIDDKGMADRIVQSKLHSSEGKYSVRRKLMAKGIDAETAEAAAERYLDEEQQRVAATAFAQKRYARYLELPAREARAKLGQALARRGFSWEVISEVVDSILDQE